MALASDIIQQAFRESNLIPVGQVPTAAQITEALGRLNTIILSTVGNEVGMEITREVIIGGDWDQSDQIQAYVPENSRLVLNHDASLIVGLCPHPREGGRFTLVDVTGDLSTNPITVNANGRKIEDLDEITCSTDNMDRQWLYRADTANWVRISQLVENDLMPLPVEFDDYFIVMLALRLNPRYSQEISQETMNALQRQRSQIRARYCRSTEVSPDFPYWMFQSNRYTLTDDFDIGVMYPYL